MELPVEERCGHGCFNWGTVYWLVPALSRQFCKKCKNRVTLLPKSRLSPAIEPKTVPVVRDCWHTTFRLLTLSAASGYRFPAAGQLAYRGLINLNARFLRSSRDLAETEPGVLPPRRANSMNR